MSSELSHCIDIKTLENKGTQTDYIMEERETEKLTTRLQLRKSQLDLSYSQEHLQDFVEYLEGIYGSVSCSDVFTPVSRYLPP